jgi:hypothetical protein
MIARRTLLLLPFLLAACDDDEVETPRSFPIPSYSYLTPIRLNVASIEIDDRTPPVRAGSLAAASPLRPADGLKEVANDRLVAAGTAGRAVFVIDDANIQRLPDGGIEGLLAVHLDVYAGQDGDRAGFAEARVARKRTSTDVDEDSRAVLYDFTLQMLKDMNVEFEYQVKRSLKDWLQTTAGTAPPPPPVQSQTLPPPPLPARPGPVSPVLRAP